MYTIATLHHLRRHLGLASSDTAEDVRLMDALRAASAQIERAAGRHFLPHRAALVHTMRVNKNELLLEDDLHIHPLLKAHPLQPAEILQGIESGKPGFDF